MAQIKGVNHASSTLKKSSLTSSWGLPRFVECNGVSWISCVVAITCALSFVYVLAMARAAGQCNNSLAAVVAAEYPSVAAAAAPPVLESPADDDAEVVSHHAKTTTSGARDLSRIVFGIAGAAKNWAKRGEYVKRWYNLDRGTTRAIVWLDQEVNGTWDHDAPPFRISEDISNLRGFNPRKRTATRIARVVTETFRLNLPDVDWFVMGDDDTIFFPSNLAQVLSKYDHRKMYYIGGNSETHSQNVLFSYNMAFGGGGFAISYPLAAELTRTQDACLARYPNLFSSDERVFACVSELGVSMTRESGFHQLDIQGNPLGILAAHPQTPILSLHHLDLVQPLFPNLTTLASVDHLLQSATIDPASLLQQSICYTSSADDHLPTISISVSWGYVVQVYPTFLTPRELETPMRTFSSLKRRNNRVEFPFNTRETPKDICKRPVMLFMDSVTANSTLLESVYVKKKVTRSSASCANLPPRLASLRRVRVLKEFVTSSWFQAPRRSCCKVTAGSEDSIELRLSDCQAGETLTSSIILQ